MRLKPGELEEKLLGTITLHPVESDRASRFPYYENNNFWFAAQIHKCIKMRGDFFRR
jgi:hypothetical protein